MRQRDEDEPHVMVILMNLTPETSPGNYSHVKLTSPGQPSYGKPTRLKKTCLFSLIGKTNMGGAQRHSQPSTAQPIYVKLSPAQPSHIQRHHKPSPAHRCKTQPSPAQPYIETSTAQPSPAQPSPAQPYTETSPAQPYKTNQAGAQRHQS